MTDTKHPIRIRSLSMPADWWEAIESARGTETVSDWLRRAVRRSLPKEVRSDLSQTRPVGKPKSPN